MPRARLLSFLCAPNGVQMGCQSVRSKESSCQEPRSNPGRSRSVHKQEEDRGAMVTLGRADAREDPGRQAYLRGQFPDWDTEAARDWA
eukprot:4844828-Amphidinium_carterae.1